MKFGKLPVRSTRIGLSACLESPLTTPLENGKTRFSEAAGEILKHVAAESDLASRLEEWPQLDWVYLRRSLVDMAMKLTGDIAEAECVVQDAFYTWVLGTSHLKRLRYRICSDVSGMLITATPNRNAKMRKAQGKELPLDSLEDDWLNPHEFF